MKLTLTQVHAEVAEHCGQVAELFKPGAKVTILIRNTTLKDADVLVTDDNESRAIANQCRLEAVQEM